MAKITLDTSVQRGETQITEIELREPKSGDLRGLSLNDLARGDVDSILLLTPRISSPFLTKADMEGLSVPDLAEIMGVVRDFFEPKNKAA